MKIKQEKGMWQEMIGTVAVFFCLTSGCQDDQRADSQPKSNSISIKSDMEKQEKSPEFEQHVKAAKQGDTDSKSVTRRSAWLMRSLLILWAAPPRRICLAKTFTKTKTPTSTSFEAADQGTNEYAAHGKNGQG